MIIETARLLLRPVAAPDARALIELDSDPAVMRYISGGAPTPAETVTHWVIPRAVAESAARRGGGMWVATDTRSGWFVGCFGLRAPRHSARGELELSYRLRRSAWGRGMATEGCRAVIDAAFETSSTGRVFAGTMAVNDTSRRVMSKCGMRLVAVHLAQDRRIVGYERGEVEYEILRSEWQAHARVRRPAQTTVAGMTA